MSTTASPEVLIPEVATKSASINGWDVPLEEETGRERSKPPMTVISKYPHTKDWLGVKVENGFGLSMKKIYRKKERKGKSKKCQ